MKRLLSQILILSILMVSLCINVPVYAKQDFSVFEDFTDYVGTWDGTTVTTNGVMPSVDGGAFTNESTQTEVSGVTSGIAPDSKYGTSVKVYSAYSKTIQSTAGAKYSLDKANYQLYSAYIESSIYAQKPADGSKPPRSIRIHGLNDVGTSSTQVLALALSDNQKFSLMDVATDTEWSFDTWYDMKAWMNIYTGEYKVEVWNNGSLVTEASGISDKVKNFSEIRTVTFLHNARTNHPTYMAGKDPQITYFDNLKVQSIYKFHIDGVDTTKHAILDFENIDLTSKATINAYNSLGTFLYGNSGNADGTTLEKVETDRGNSLRIKPWVIDENSEYTFSTSDGIVRDSEGNQVYARNTMLYPQVYFDFKKANHIYDAAYFKTGFKFEDSGFGSFNIQVTNYYTALSVAPNGQFTAFGKETGIWFAEDKWYDVEGIIDLDTGYYTVSLTQEGNSTKYQGTGFVTPVDLTSGGAYTAIYRLRVNYWNRSKHNDWSIPTSMLVDDMQLGPVSKLQGAVAKTYAFSNADDAAAFTTIGGTATTENEALKLTGAADGTMETVTSMAMPFVNTTFKYSADVTLSDLTADRSLIAQNQTAYSGGRVLTPVEIAKFGADGKLYIGETEIADVTVETGTYKADVIFNQANYTAAVTISKDGEVIAEADAVLGTAAAKIISVDWKVGAGAETVTALDNIAYGTVYDFGIDESLSTTGKDIVMTSADDVVVKFTNAIDKDSFTTDAFSVNNGAVAVTDITFVDDYTAKLDFAKTQGTHYHVDFTVSDIYGNTLTDYIEFDTIRQDLEMTAVSFKKGDKALSLVEAGDITATFSAKANNGTSYDMLYVVGLYQGGRLVDSDFDTFTVGETRADHTLNITVPDDGKLYILKAFVWDAENGKPYCEPNILEALSADTKVALVKFDDLNTNNVDKFADIANWAEENDIKMNFIFMVNYFDPDREKGALCDETDIAKLKSMYDSPYIELTSHGYYGDNSFFGVKSLEEQLDDFANVKRTTENMGMTITSMAPPNNQVSADTVAAFNANPQYKALMVRAGNDATLNSYGFFDEDNTFETFWKYIDVEVGSTGNTADVDTLKANWNAAMDKGYEYVLLQAHPGGWQDGGNPETYMYEFLLWLKSQGVVFMHATEYAEYVSAL